MWFGLQLTSIAKTATAGGFGTGTRGAGWKLRKPVLPQPPNLLGMSLIFLSTLKVYSLFLYLLFYS